MDPHTSLGGPPHLFGPTLSTADTDISSENYMDMEVDDISRTIFTTMFQHAMFNISHASVA